MSWVNCHQKRAVAMFATIRRCILFSRMRAAQESRLTEIIIQLTNNKIIIMVIHIRTLPIHYHNSYIRNNNNYDKNQGKLSAINKSNCL